VNLFRLEELQVLDIKFLYGCSKPTIVVLYQVTNVSFFIHMFIKSYVFTLYTVLQISTLLPFYSIFFGRCTQRDKDVWTGIFFLGGGGGVELVGKIPLGH
jgi:hypothetical protein